MHETSQQGQKEIGKESAFLLSDTRRALLESCPKSEGYERGNCGHEIPTSRLM